jgi:hypothetical protein
MSTAKHVYFQSLYYGKYDFNLPNTHNTRDTTYSHDEKRKKKKTLFFLSNYFVIFGSHKSTKIQNQQRGQQALENYLTLCWARVRGAGGPEVGFRELVFIYFNQ